MARLDAAEQRRYAEAIQQNRGRLRNDDQLIHDSSRSVGRRIGDHRVELAVAVLAETVEQLLRGLDGDERQVIQLSLQGYSTQEIARQLNRAERSVRRLRERVRLQLERLRSDSCPA